MERKKKEITVKKCLQIFFSAEDIPEDFLNNFVKKNAVKRALEGIARLIHNEIRVEIVVCGIKEQVDDFVDALSKGSSKVMLDDIEVEPYAKEKDYRNVFRVIL